MKFLVLSAALAATLCACTEARPGHSSTNRRTEVAQCVDVDKDGFGEDCSPGKDCDDHDPQRHDGCLRCATPNEGCECRPGTQPAACFLDRTFGADGGVMCHEGTRYCREAKWSGCESVFSYPLPERSTTAVIDPNAPVAQCNDCNVACYRVSDNLDPVDGGLVDSGTNVAWATGGGLTLGTTPDSAGTGDAGPGSIVSATPPACTDGIGADLDCDGIPNTFDPYPNDPPLATANPSIFLQIGPGETGTGQLDLNFFLNSADIYFLVDQSGSMDDERDQLKADLANGDFVNSSTYQCADFDFDRQPNNELKTKGIVGAIRCKIRDANFGTGFFREIPFASYANADHIAFGHYQDITGDVDAVRDAIETLTTIGNQDWPEASMVALHNVLTGNGLYFGTQRRGVPARTDCPEHTWGYPCFREDAVPIVVLFTDAQFHNGPDTNTEPYGATSYAITAGTNDAYTPVPNTNESFNSAANLGDLTSKFVTITGDTTNLDPDIGASLVGTTCISSSDGTDAVFKFDLAQQKQVVIESTGSHFDTVLGLFTGIPGSPTDLTASTNLNELATTAVEMGNVTDNYVRVAGNTASMAADYGWSTVGCDASTTSPDAVFKFSVSATTQVALDTSGSSFDTVLGLYGAEPEIPVTPTAIADTNDDYTTAYNAGEIYNFSKSFSGDTSVAAIHADYSQTQVGCGVDGTGNDVAYSFTLSTPTRVRISSEGSAFDTVLGLYDSLASPVGAASVANTNETQATAYNAGTLDGRILQLTGSTSGMRSNYASSQMPSCTPADAAPDALFKFHLDEAKDVQIDTVGTGWDTVLGLFDSAYLDPATYVSTDNADETFATAKNLGTINSQEIVVTGANTQSMHADYTVQPDITCGVSDLAPDATYRFHLDTPTRVRVDLANSSFDTVLSLHNVQPGEPALAVSDTNDVASGAINVGDIYHQSFQRTGSTASFAHDYDIGCNAGSTAKDAVYKFSLSTATTVQIDTIGTNFDTVLGLFREPMVVSDPPTPTPVASGTTHKLRTNAYDIGTLDGQWYRYSGSTSTMGAEWTENNNCGGQDSAPDAFFKFTLNSTRNVTITTTGSSFDTVIYLYKYTNAGLTTYALDSCDHSNSGDESITTSLTSGTYFIVVKGDRSSDFGNYLLSVRDDVLMSTKVACDDDGGGYKTSKISRSLAAGNYAVVVSGLLAASNGPYTIRFRDSTWWNSFGQLYCHDDVSTTDRTSFIEQNLTAGDYWFMVKGHSSYHTGPYALRVSDITHPPVGPNVLTCDDNGGGGSVSKIVRTALPAGDYWVALKGKTSGSAGAYKLNIKDMSATASGSIVQCDDNGGDNPGSLIERNMQAGTYQLVLKGKTAASKGAYKLSIRDITRKPIDRLGCANDGGAGTSSYLERSLSAGTYYAVLKGNNPTDQGAYSFGLRDVTNRPLSSTTCDDDGSTYKSSKITRTLDPGTHYVVLKGKDAAAKGPYQLSIGAGATHSSSYSPPLWPSTLAAIQNTGARVISILSCHDDSSHGNNSTMTGDCDETRAQAKALANASQALGANLLPLVYDIDSNGAGLSTNVVGGISALAKYLEMNVSVRVIFEPDPNPGFNVTVRAIDQLGDGCSGLLGITHQNCAPGAAPRFQVDFQNPTSPNAVPLNPSDPKGGYNFRAELIADNQFIIEQVPIYIIPIPEDPVGPPAPTYYPTGTYHQDTAAPGCKGNQAPDWRDLSWNADVYGNTSVTFSACTAQDAIGLNTCIPHTIATISGVGTCASDSDCTLGYCDTAIGVCQVATAGTCMSSEQCAANAFCDSNTHLCTYNSQPIYIGPSLGADNFKSFIRMSIGLSGTTPYTHPPVLHQWELTYLCNQLL